MNTIQTTILIREDVLNCALAQEQRYGPSPSRIITAALLQYYSERVNDIQEPELEWLPLTVHLDRGDVTVADIFSAHRKQLDALEKEREELRQKAFNWDAHVACVERSEQLRDQGKHIPCERCDCLSSRVAQELNGESPGEDATDAETQNAESAENRDDT